MTPKTNAERQKAYRERLKKEKPDKHEEIRIKHLKKVKENIKKKKETLTEKDIEKQRAKWRKANAERAEKKKKAKKTIQENNASTLEVIDKPKNNTTILKERVQKLTDENTQLKRCNKNLRQACNRMKRRIIILKKQIDEQTKLNKDAPIETAKTSQCDDTPLAKTNSFLEQTLPTISNAEKEKIKKKLLLLNTITDSLKTEYNKADPKGKKILKKVATNEIANKHKLKSRITDIFGLKGRIRMMQARNEIRKKYKKDIHDFFEREDVSRPSAGKNECITRNKDKVQKRYLLNPVYKLYKQYKAEGGKASLQTFYRFRPFYVVKPRLQDRNTCACIKHCNLSFKAESLKKLGLLQTCDIDELMDEIVCSKCFKCMYSECSECQDKKLAINLTIDENTPVQWLQWKIGTHTYTKISKEKSEEKRTKKYLKQVVKGTVTTLIKEFQDDLQKFKTHYFNIAHQYRSWKKCIGNLNEDEAALICDFSENFSCKQSEEIQAVHFGGSRNQITLHTCVLYRKNVKPQSICSISPNNEHGPGAIWAHLDPILKLCTDLKIKKMHIFSDSPATQYRQKNNFFMFQKRLKENGFEYATWNYFEASHGKGPADGVGGALKRQLDNYISHGNDIINAKDAYDYLKANSKVKIFYIKENDIQEMTKMIPDNVIPIKGTMKLHQIVTDGKETIKYKWLSCFDCEKNICCDCYYTKEHELVKTNITTEPEITPCGKKRQYTKKREKPAKRLKRITSSTTTETDVTMSFHSDSDLIDVEIGNEDIDNNTDDEDSYKNLPIKIDSKSDIIEKTDFRVKIQDTNKKEVGNTPKTTDKGKVTILSSVRLLPENCAFYGLQTCLRELQPIPSTFDVSVVQKGKGTIMNEKENKPVKEEYKSKGRIQTDDNKLNPKVKKLNSESNFFTLVDSVKKTDMNKKLQDLTYQELSKKGGNVIELCDDDDKEIQNKIYQGITGIGQNIEEELNCNDDMITHNDTYLNESQKKELSPRDTYVNIGEEIQKNATYNCGDTVLTRYFKRSWKYYIGVINEVNLNKKKYDVSYYKINGNKTSVKFTIPKYADRDRVPEDNLVKKIELRQISNHPVEYVLMNDEDSIYF